MIWRVFFSCCCGTFVMAMLDGIVKGNFEDWSGAYVKFGDFTTKHTVNVTRLIPAAIILGILGGMLGSFFINVNTRVN